MITIALGVSEIHSFANLFKKNGILTGDYIKYVAIYNDIFLFKIYIFLNQLYFFAIIYFVPVLHLQRKNMILIHPSFHFKKQKFLTIFFYRVYLNRIRINVIMVFRFIFA